MHVPVLKEEIITHLNPKANQNFVDCTFGQGGHTKTILEKNKPKGMVLGIEKDGNLCEKIRLEITEKRLILVNDSYVNLKEVIDKERFENISGILFDLGLSSWHLEDSGRGFSFRKDEPLIMRYDLEERLTAQEIVNSFSKREIEDILKEYGEERFAFKIAQKITEERKLKPIKTTFQLVEVIKRATPGWYHRKKIHFATRTFQALRIVVNNELENIKKGLSQALEVLNPGGKLVVVSFHSLEDRIVKQFYKNSALEGKIKIITKKPIEPSLKEINLNPRSRSAKLRVAEKNNI